MGHKVSRTLREKAALLCDDAPNAMINARCGAGAIYRLVEDESFVSKANFLPVTPTVDTGYRGFFGGRQIIHISEGVGFPEYMVIMKYEDSEYTFEIPH